MNQITKHIFSFMAIIALFLMIKTPVQAIRSTSGVDFDDICRQISCTERSVTVRWESQQGIDKYDKSIKREVDYYTLRTGEMTEGDRKWTFDNRYCTKYPEDGSDYYTATLNMPANHWAKVQISLTYKLYRKNEEGNFVFSENVTDNTELVCNAYTKPLPPTKNQFGIPKNTKIKNLSLNSWIEVKDSQWFYKKQIELYKGNKKLKTFDLSYSNDKEFKLQRGCVYQYRARYYNDNTINGFACYSDWSPWKGFVVPKNLTFSSNPGKKGFKITLGKINGVSKYTVYTSLKRTTGYKKAKTFKAKSKKKYSVQVTKKYKKGKKNYVKLVPYINLGNYKGPSDFAIVTSKPLKISK